jgi:hypothetical protein
MYDYLNVNFDIAYWNDFYNINGFDLPDWYFNFEITKPEIVEQWKPESEILVIGAGVSSILNYLSNKNFPYVTVLDYSPPLIEYLKTVYSKKPECEDWDCKIY